MADTSTQLATLIDGLGLNARQIAGLTANLETLNRNELAELNAKVAAAEAGLTLTRNGFEVLGKALAGKQLRFTRVAYGDSLVDGVKVEPTDEEIFEFNALLHLKKECPIVNVQHIGGGMAAITFAVQNETLAEGFFISETGIFAEDPDTGAEILYAYRNTGVKVKWLPGGDGSDIWDLRVHVTTVVSGAMNITAIIDASLLYVTQEEFAEHIASSVPHTNIPQLKNELNTTERIWATGTDNNLHPITVEHLATQIFGGNASDIPQMNSRISQAEVNIANIYTQLKIEEDLGLKPNLLIFDDFVNPDKTDYYRQNVITSVAGISNVRVVSNEGLHSGSWYTLSDGVHNEPVQVTAIAKNGDAHVAIFDEPVINTYDLTCTQLYRSTTLIENGVGVGAGDIRTDVFNFSASWQGTSTNTTANLMLNTTFANQAAFELSGDWAFSADGEFTLA